MNIDSAIFELVPRSSHNCLCGVGCVANIRSRSHIGVRIAEQERHSVRVEELIRKSASCVNPPHLISVYYIATPLSHSG